MSIAGKLRQCDEFQWCMIWGGFSLPTSSTPQLVEKLVKCGLVTSPGFDMQRPEPGSQPCYLPGVWSWASLLFSLLPCLENRVVLTLPFLHYTEM